ncbi:DUF2247 family protein [Paenibacillus donghaensis]|nr:DUF2247 family protein [Paenibacillus donghaensis]
MLPYNFFVLNLVNITWSDILFAIKQRFLTYEAAIEHAIHVINREELPSNDVIELACLDKEEDIDLYLDKLSSSISEKDYSMAKEKNLYLILKWVFENKNNYSDPLEVVECIYADFDYPEEISRFVRYMPTNQPMLYSLELNIERLYKNWNDYLEKQKKRYSVSD